MDPRFRVETIAATPEPNRLVWRAMHQDYCEDFVADQKAPEERKAAEICVRRLLASERMHGGPYEHPQISFNVGWFPHSVMQQARTHRCGISFDCQSGRYTGNRILDVIDGKRELEEVFYLRPLGNYSDRQGKKYEYTEDWRTFDLKECMNAAHIYASKIAEGFAEEHARGLIPFDFRQHFVVSFNARSLMHFADMRSKLDAQIEIRWLCELLMPKFKEWMPELAEWYAAHRYAKARLAP
jgi:thymidylate synthase (FAD)